MDITFDYETKHLEHCSPKFSNLFVGCMAGDSKSIRQTGSFENSPEDLTIAHNAKFDMKCRMKDNPSIELGQVYDTQIAFKVLREDLPKEAYKLESLAGIFYDYPNYKKLVDFKDKKENYYDTPDKMETLKLYNRHDLYATQKLREISEPALKRQGMWSLFLMLMDFTKELAYSEMHGIKVDQEELTKQEVLLKEKIDSIEEYFITIADINWNSPAQVVEYFLSCGFKLYKPRGKKNYSVDEKALERLSNESKVAEELLEYRHLQKAHKTYVVGFRNRLYDWTYYPDYNQLGTKTGRLSEKFIQLMPRKETSTFKRFIVSKFDGGLLLEADWSQLEVALNAELTQDPQLLKDVKEGITLPNGEHFDIHNYTRHMLPFLPDRTRAKNVIFNFFYGGHNWTLVNLYGLTDDQATKFLDYANKRYPRVKETHIKKKYLVDTKGYIITEPTGRRRYTSKYTQAYNTDIQGLGSDFNKIMFIEVSKILRDNLLRSHIVAEIHDSLVIDIHPEETDEVIGLVKYAYDHFNDYWTIYFDYKLKLDYKAEFKIGVNLYDTTKI